MFEIPPWRKTAWGRACTFEVTQRLAARHENGEEITPDMALKETRDVLKCYGRRGHELYECLSDKDPFFRDLAKREVGELNDFVGRFPPMVKTEANSPADGAKLDLFNVTAPWNPDDDEEGTYSASVWAVDEAAALRAIAEEMADSGAKYLSTEHERLAYNESIAKSSADVYLAKDQLQSNMQQLFAKELFPNGCVRQINMKALANLLATNREALLAPEVPALPVQAIEHADEDGDDNPEHEAAGPTL